MYMEFSDLPETVRAAVERCGRKGGAIPVEVADQWYAYAGHKGSRAVAVCVDLSSGRVSDVECGAWGGSNPFTHSPMDRGETHPVPPGCAVVAGSAGGHGTFVTVYLHPDSTAPVLPSRGPELTPTQQRVLDAHVVYNSRGRREYFNRHPVPDLELTKAELAALGLLKVARNGAAKVTAAGRNARKSRGSFVDHEIGGEP